MNAGRLAGLLGLMTGAGVAGRPEEANAAAIPGIGGRLVAAAKDVVGKGGSRRTMPAGTLEPLGFDTARLVDPRITSNEVHAGPHMLVSRSGTGEMSMEDAAGKLEQMLNSRSAIAIPNFPQRNPHGHRLSSGVMYDTFGNTPFAIPFSARQDGKILFYTGFIPDGAKRQFADSRVKDFFNTHPELRPSGETPFPSHIRSQESPPAVAQQRGLSAGGEPLFKESLGDLLRKGKKNLPALAGASGAALSHYGAEPEPAHAFPGVQAYAGKPDLPLESPWLDPADIIAAPVGVPGAAAKAFSMAMAPAVSYGLDKLGGILGMLASDEERQR